MIRHESEISFAKDMGNYILGWAESHKNEVEIT